MATTKLVQAKVLKVEDLIALFSDLSGVISYKEAKLAQDIYNAEQSEELSSKEQKLLKKNKKELKTLGDVKTNLEKTLAPHATCEKLIELYAKNFEQNKDDVAWMKRAAKLLNKKECTESDIFFSISEALYNLAPSPSAAANMGIRSLKRKDYEKAEAFYTYALENEPDEINKAHYAYRLAQTYGAMNKNNSAKTYALKAAFFRSGWGDPYLLIGDLYAKTSRQCGELKTEFLKRVGYWAAIDKYEYAKRLDPQLSAKANERIDKYTEQMPSKTDIFTEGLIDEPTYEIDCWYSETVKIRVP
jgi:tetratricopeptide (TPR) repeat protein